MLIPSAVALVLWLVASGYLVFTGFYDREVASSVRQVSIPAVTGLGSLQQERRLSIAYVTGSSRDRQALVNQRQQTDRLLTALRGAATSALALAPQSIKTRWKTLTGYLGELPRIRGEVDDGKASQQQVYDFYNGLLDAATGLFDTQARVVPDVTATQGGIAATDVFRASDLMSRASSIMTGAFSSHRLTESDYLRFVGLVGAYHADLTDVAPHLRPDALRKFQAIEAGPAWRELVAAENALIVAGPWTHGVPRALPVTAAAWDTTTAAVSGDLIGLTIAQADEVSAQALSTGDNQLLTALLGSLIALAVAVAAILWAVRQSQVLVDRALSTRLAQLGRDAVAVVDQRLPDMMARLRRREKVDPAVELPSQEYGEDEIGKLADVLNRSLRVAVGAAVDEATTRAAGTAMLMGVARRPQRPLQRGLQVIEDLQKRIDDEKLLADLFDINHQLAQTRRFLENLIILAGGQTGRRFHKPVPLRRVLLAAVAETQQYQRITVRRVVDVALVGNVVASSTHLLSELLDNALAFSAPGSDVWVSCTQVRRGVVVEIEDAGVGMIPEDLDRANELLATAPAPDVTMLRDGAQVGLWVVAELAKRLGAQVTLRTSAYGGLLAVVLLPERVIVPDLDAAAPGETGQVAPPPALVASDAIARPGAGEPRAHAPLPSRPLPARFGGRDEPLRGGVPAIVLNAMETGGSGQPGHGNDKEGARIVVAGGTNKDRQQNTAATEHQVRTDFSLAPVRGANGSGPPPPLPERKPQQHLAPELREEATDGTSAQEPTLARSPEENRERFSRYQRGWRAGRDGDTSGNINQQ